MPELGGRIRKFGNRYYGIRLADRKVAVGCLQVIGYFERCASWLSEGGGSLLLKWAIEPQIARRRSV
jgi:hypothetical protein